jgi:hypothetical protein
MGIELREIVSERLVKSSKHYLDYGSNTIDYTLFGYNDLCIRLLRNKMFYTL